MSQGHGPAQNMILKAIFWNPIAPQQLIVIIASGYILAFNIPILINIFNFEINQTFFRGITQKIEGNSARLASNIYF